MLPLCSSAFSPSNERFVPGTPSHLLVNATLWTGTEVLEGVDVLLKDGLVARVSATGSGGALDGYVDKIDVGGKWVTPGIVDLHSHIGVGAAPGMRGNADTNSIKAPILPWLRSIDGFNTHDQALNNTILGGVTTMLVLPGSANNIGGQAFVFKPRKTSGNSPSEMILEPPFEDGKRVGGRWRHMKHAMGENIKGLHGATRMDQAFNFRTAYEEGRKLKVKQDAWCAKGLENTEPFPVDLNWEALADVIRGNVKINVHSYQTNDFDQLVRLTNEFKFHVTALHHATEAYLVPSLLKKAFGGPPAVAQFATHARYKLESWRGSEYAPLALANAGLTNIMKSDHPVLDSRYLLWEAAQSHIYGLNWTLAMDSVFSAPAKAMGMDHRIGHVVAGHDADVIVWDSMPLTLGATPAQVFIDGIPQLDSPHVVAKPHLQFIPPSSSNAEAGAFEAVASDGNPDRSPKQFLESIVYTGVRSAFSVNDGDVQQVFGSSDLSSSFEKHELGMVVIEGGKIVCVGLECEGVDLKGLTSVDLKGGSILPGMTSFGAPLGIQEMPSEASTQDGAVFDALGSDVPKLLAGQVIKGSESLSFGGKDLLIAHQAGLLTSISHPSSPGLVSGLSTAFRNSASNILAPGAIAQDVASLHVVIGHGGGGGRSYGGGSTGSISEQIRALKNLLLGAEDGTELGEWFEKVSKGKLPLAISVTKADHIASILILKKEVEKKTGSKLRIVLEGGQEAHLLADELAEASVGVILNPPRSYPGTWDTHRTLAGPPATKHTTASLLTSKGVVVGLGHLTSDATRHARYDAAWNYVSVPSVFTPASAIALVSTNLNKLLGVEIDTGLLAVEGDAFGAGSRIVGVLAGGRIEVF
ncbi:hypothetical protein BDY24DRAFT_340073 [Mrakia frigida]|uniref:uncharacterized protein n=1 Tax=Mrakia frigida TaxID=29902 RepID=UPI003FCBF9C9